MMSIGTSTEAVLGLGLGVTESYRLRVYGGGGRRIGPTWKSRIIFGKMRRRKSMMLGEVPRRSRLQESRVDKEEDEYNARSRVAREEPP